ncbi:MAG: ribbon-helix-helix protein, CopG family [candidate division WS1 bacterium]|jgi:predicted transcriptional regulator|nr:ribbon-helix-helix protein, CopG family [candidate division WS1 bacterium]
MAATVRVNEQTHRTLQELSRGRGQSMTDVLAEAVQRLRDEDLLRRTNAAYAALREDPEAWAELERERAEWDATLADGLEDE